MSDLNQCNFIGRIGRDPEIKYTQDGTAIANFSIAVSESWKSKDGQKKEKIEWVRCVAWRKLAEIIGEYVHKGQQIFVSGKFTSREWERDGIKRYISEIVVNDMQMLGGRSQSDVADKSKPVQKPENDYQNVETQTGGSSIDDSGIPF